MSSKLEQSKASGPHAFLNKMTGTWEGTSRVWFDPAELEDESPVRGTMRPLMNGKYILHEYETAFKGKPVTGMALYAYNLDTQKFQSAWIDSFHSGSFILFSESAKADADMRVLGSYAYVTPETEQHWGWRTELEFRGEELLITAYNISPEGEESRATEFAYRKVS
ncbi:DUF1579 family protein [Flaviaesturariibacter amylovorans]|uniref:DUF1579 domain-containing protein n=1 Tax=Flaviaesturariibacter amylovorans TaxID=1084520 RepID=A0ABP8HPK2_9BACT